MVLNTFTKDDIQKIVERELQNAMQFSWNYIVSADKTTYLTVNATCYRGQGIGTESCSHTLIAIPGRRAELYMELDGSISYTPRVFQRFVERVCKLESKQLKTGECIARYFGNHNGSPVVIGNTAERDRSIAMVSDGILLCRTDTPNGIPLANTFVPWDMLHASQTEALHYARHGDYSKCMEIYNTFFSVSHCL